MTGQLSHLSCYTMSVKKIYIWRREKNCPVSFFIPYCLPANSSLILFNILHLLFLIVLWRVCLWFAYKKQWCNKCISVTWILYRNHNNRRNSMGRGSYVEFIVGQVAQVKVWMCKKVSFLQVATINVLSVWYFQNLVSYLSYIFVFRMPVLTLSDLTTDFWSNQLSLHWNEGMVSIFLVE